MTLLIIEPENFTSLSNLIIAILSFLTSIGTLLLTYIMAKTAIKALDTWKTEKHYDVYVEAFSKLPVVKKDLENLVSEIYHYLIFNKKNNENLNAYLIEFDLKVNSELKKQGIYTMISKLEVDDSVGEQYIKILKEYKKLAQEMEQISMRIHKCFSPFPPALNGAGLSRIEILFNQVSKTRDYLLGIDGLFSKLQS